ncbi:hypothetical protein [Desertibacillus haloalkaliphilus]|uniref:hypothetical protein n=1 Tax=Desertibacillus haloalkaliphilus TaxID=1328930 RepID=UPI001C252E2D|nr:hypothetical protein [Desertibacillus haloalkaliphilus]MBU8907769.1 hypothetical protein [Desertibacillus haloalkaliphilus]
MIIAIILFCVVKGRSALAMKRDQGRKLTRTALGLSIRVGSLRKKKLFQREVKGRSALAMKRDQGRKLTRTAFDWRMRREYTEEGRLLSRCDQNKKRKGELCLESVTVR